MLEDDEMFNSGLLKDRIGQMFSSGKRHVAIDISPLDYIYSDGINALVTLNKRAQESGGTLALLSPQAKVVGILQTAGIQSAMSVVSGEGELMGLSNEISAAAAAAGSAAQSEFESLRSEIGSAFGDVPLSSRASAPPPPPPPPPPPVYAPPPAMEASMELRPMAPPPPPPPPPAPAFQPPPDPLQSDTMSFGELGGSAFGTLDKPSKAPSFDDDGFGGKKKKKSKDPFDDDDFGSKKKFKEPLDDFGSDDDNVFKAKKGAPVAAIAAVLVLCVLAAAGYYAVKNNYLGIMDKFGGNESSATTEVASTDVSSGPSVGSEPDASDIPVATVEVDVPKPIGYKPGDKPSKPDGKQDKKQDSKPDPKQKSGPSYASAPSYSSPSYSEPSYSEPAPSYTPPAPEPEPAPAPPPPTPKVEQVNVTSSPSGATVEVDGKRVGTTPHTFKPASWGDITITVSMSGYEKMTKTVEFEGGTLPVSFSLSKASSSAPPPSAPAPSAPSASGGGGSSIFIATLPPKAEVYVGGKLVGTSNEGELQVPTGTHQVRFVKDGVEKTETITFNPGKNPTKFVNLKQ